MFIKEIEEFCRTEISIEKIIPELKSNDIEFENVNWVKESIVCFDFIEFTTKLLKFVIIALLLTFVPDDRKYLESLNRMGSLDGVLTS